MMALLSLILSPALLATPLPVNRPVPTSAAVLPTPRAQTDLGMDSGADPGTDSRVAPSILALPAPPPSVADADVREFIAVAARKHAGREAMGGIGPTDKLLVISRSSRDFPEILGSAGIGQRQQLMPPPEGAVALVRFRQNRDPILPGPSRLDLEYAAQYKLPLFVIGEWSRAIPMWEVAWLGSRVQYRSIGDVGEIGPWRD